MVIHKTEKQAKKDRAIFNKCEARRTGDSDNLDMTKWQLFRYSIYVVSIIALTIILIKTVD